MEEKFGIVTLLDALGARSASTRESLEYLQGIEKIRTEIGSSLDITLETAPESIKDLLAQLRPRFFGDSILLTYSVPDESHMHEFVGRLAFVLCVLLAKALPMGFLFRGAIAIGEYLESNDVVLGPAVVDAANWYEKLEMIGVMATPRATNCLKSHFSSCGKTGHYKAQSLFLHEYAVPNKVCPGMVTYSVKWPSIYLRRETKNKMQWYYDAIKKQKIPLGTENKYINTEAYIRHCLETMKQKTE